jgi:hypothetical protein
MTLYWQGIVTLSSMAPPLHGEAEGNKPRTCILKNKSDLKWISKEVIPVIKGRLLSYYLVLHGKLCVYKAGDLFINPALP